MQKYCGPWFGYSRPGDTWVGETANDILLIEPAEDRFPHPWVRLRLRFFSSWSSASYLERIQFFRERLWSWKKLRALPDWCEGGFSASHPLQASIFMGLAAVARMRSSNRTSRARG